MGTITTYAKPELKEINVWRDSVDVTDAIGHRIATYFKNASCDIDVTFHSIIDWNKKDKTLYTVDTRDRK